MRKYSVLLVLMVFVVAATSGCSLIVKDPVVDAQTVIIEVAGEEIVKEDVQQTIESVLDYQEYIYSLYGYSFDRTDEDVIASAQETAIDSMIEQAVCEQKIAEFGLDQITDEELAAISETADETYEYYADNIETSYFSDTELVDEELDAAIEAKMLELGYSTREELFEQEKLNEEYTKLQDYVVKDVSVSEDEIETQYSQGVTDAMDTYASYPTQYASDLNNGEIIYYRPEGYRYVKNLLIMISDDEQTEISTLTSQIEDDEDSLSAVEDAIAELPEDPAEDSEDQQKTREEMTAQVDSLTAEIDELTTELEEKTAAAYAAIQPTVNIVLSSMEAGEDFDALIEEYGEDTGMTVEPAKSEGYLVCEDLSTYVDEFVEASMALENIGDISDPFRTSYGIHIVQYASDLEAGEVELSDIHDSISDELLSEKQDTLYNETVSQWVTEANAKVYTDRLAD